MAEEQDDVVALFRELTVATAAAHAQVNRLLRPAGQSLARWEVLDRCAAESRSVPAVARDLRLTRQAVQRVVDELVTEGLLEASGNPLHRRSPVFGATRAGAATLTAMRGRVDGWYASLRAALSPTEIDELRTLLAALHAAADAFDGAALIDTD